MKRLWLVAAAIAPLSFAAGAPGHVQAQTTISGTQTTPVTTTSDGNITITGTVSPSAGGTVTSPVAAVTIDSNNTVDNQGSISFSGSNYSTGIQANGGETGLITNSGSISVSESAPSTDGTNDNITYGPFDSGNNRYGISIVGTGNFTGIADANDGNITNVIDNTGTITVVGENSAGIYIGTAAAGGIFDSGTISVTGGNFSGTVGVLSPNISYGIQATAVVGGNVTITGAITATGENATGVSLEQGLNGQLLLQNTITATGYRTTTASLDPSVLNTLFPSQILQGGPALAIGGDVTDGIVIDVFRAGNTTANITANAAGEVISFGSAPALLLGGANPMTVGLAGNSTYGLVIGGQVEGAGDFPNFGGNAIQIGGVNNLPVEVGNVSAGGNFSTVTIDGGIDISGDVAASAANVFGLATSETGTGNAIALHLGDGASTPLLTVSGDLTAVTAVAAPPSGNFTTPSAVAVQIDSGATLSSLNNSGNISASITGVAGAGSTPASGGTNGIAYAIDDQSGTLGNVTNTGTISATITPIVGGQVVAAGQPTVALFLGDATGNVTVTQTVDPANVNGITNPSITGDVIFGDSGTALTTSTLDLEGGNLTGNTSFGSGADSLIIGNATGTSAFMIGGLTQAGNGTLNVAVNNGQLLMTSTGNITVPTLTVGSTGALVFSINPADGTQGEFLVTGNATLADGAKIGVNLLSKLTLTSPTTFVLIQGTGAGDITSGGLDTTFLGQLPFLYSSTAPVVNQGVDGNVSVTLTQKTPQQLGLNPAEAAAYPAIFAAFDRPDTPSGALPPGAIGSIKSAMLGADNEGAFIHLYDQFLPDYGGGVFETLVEGQNGLSRAEADAPAKLTSDTTRGWVQEIGYSSNEQASSSVNGFNGQGIGVAAGIEAARGNSAVGVAAAFMTASVANGGQTSDGVQAGSAFEAGVYMRAGGPQGLKVTADLNGGIAWFSSRRLITQESETTVTTPASTSPTTGVTTPASSTLVDTVSLWREASSRWLGALMSADFGVSYEVNLGKRFYVRPEASIDYDLLYEGGHTETGGGAAFDLALAPRTSQQATAQGDLVFGANLGDAATLWQPEVTVGWRQIVVGGPGATTAQFASGGQTFTLSSSFTQKSGIVGRIGVRASGAYADFSADAGGVFSSGYSTYDARAVARFLF